MARRSNPLHLRPERQPPSVRRMKAGFEEIMARRECGDCQECCVALGVHEINLPIYEPCRFQCPTGCSIYRSRPTSCREYVCAWKVSFLPESVDLRPDVLRAILDLDTANDGRIYVRCWQLDSPRQVLDDPRVRLAAWAMASQVDAPVFAYFKEDSQRSIHLISRLERWRPELARVFPDYPIFPLSSPGSLPEES